MLDIMNCWMLTKESLTLQKEVGRDLLLPQMTMVVFHLHKMLISETFVHGYKH
jgi:hypothetical protein